jgi:hypothetical protein
MVRCFRWLCNHFATRLRIEARGSSEHPARHCSTEGRKEDRADPRLGRCQESHPRSVAAVRHVAISESRQGRHGYSASSASDHQTHGSCSLERRCRRGRPRAFLRGLTEVARCGVRSPGSASPQAVQCAIEVSQWKELGGYRGAVLRRHEIAAARCSGAAERK